MALEFLFTTCPHCQRASQTLNRLQKEFTGRPFQAVGAAFNENAVQLVPDYIRRYQLTYPVGDAARDTVVEYLQHPLDKPLNVPQLLVIDRKGLIRGQWSGGDAFFQDEEKNLRVLVEALLKAPATASKKKAQ